MTLLVELRRPATKQWLLTGRVNTGDDGSLSHNDPAGRQIYRFRCLGDHSILERSTSGVDTELGPLRMISTLAFEPVARLDANNPTFEMWIQTDRMTEPQLIRFRHQ